MKKLTIVFTIIFLSFCIPKKIPNLVPLALTGSVFQPKPYTLGDVGLGENSSNPDTPAPVACL